MKKALRLLAVLAHPDDESLGNGGMFAKYAAEGVETYLVTATRGEHGWFSKPEDYPGEEALGAIRDQELRAAAELLGIREVSFLDYVDGHLDEADPDEAVEKIVDHIRRLRPDVVVTFDQHGLYGHPDHIAITQFTTAAVQAAADPAYGTSRSPHSVAKLYYMAWTEDDVAIYENAFGPMQMTINGELRGPMPWADWAITTNIDTVAHWRQAWHAIECHRTQLPGYEKLLALPDSYHERLWGIARYYRAMTRVAVPQGKEDDLFAGLRGDRIKISMVSAA